MNPQGSYDGKGSGRSGIYEGSVSEEQERDDSFGDYNSEEQESDDLVGEDESEEQVSDDLSMDDDSEKQVYNGGQGPGRSEMYEGGVFEEQLSDEFFRDEVSMETEKTGSQESGVSAAKSSRSQQPLNIGEQVKTDDETEAELIDNTAAAEKLSPMRIVKIDTEPLVKGKTINEMNHLSIAEDIIRTIVGKKPKTATEQQAKASETSSTSDIGASASLESSSSISIVDKLVYQELRFKREIHKRLSDEHVNNPFTEQHFRLKLFKVNRHERSKKTKLFSKLLIDESREKLKKEKEMTISYLLFFYRNITTKSDTSTEMVIKPEIFILCTGYSVRRALKYADENFPKAVEKRTLQFPFQHVEITKDSGPIIKEKKYARSGHEILFSVWDYLDNIVGNRTRKLKEHSSLYSSSLKGAFRSKKGKELATSIEITEKGMKIRRSLTFPQIGLALDQFSKICLNKKTFLTDKSNKIEEVDDPNFEMHDFYCKIEDRDLRADLDGALQEVLQDSMKGQPTNLYLVHRDYEKWIKSEEICLYARKNLNRDPGANKRNRRAHIKTWDQPPSLDEVLKHLQKCYSATDFQTDWLEDVLIKFSDKKYPLKEFIYTRLSLREIGTYIYHYGTWLQMSAHYLYLIEKDFVQKMTSHFIEASTLHLLPWKNIQKEEKEKQKQQKYDKNNKEENKEKGKQEEKAKTNVTTSSTKENKNVATSSTKAAEVKANVATSSTKEEKAKTNVATSSAKEERGKTDAATFLTNEAKANTNVAASSTEQEKAKTNVATSSSDKAKANTYRFTFENFDKEKESEKWKTHFESLHNRDTFGNVQSEIDILTSAECLTVSCELQNTTTAKVAAHMYVHQVCFLKESGYNKSHALLNTLLIDTGIKMITCDTKSPHNIEICDILIWDDNTTYFVHVKLGFQGSSIREVCSQIRNAADHIYREQTISAGTGIIKKYWEVLTTPSRREFHQEETKRILENMGEDKFMELFHSKRDIVFVLACRDVRVKANFRYEHNLPRDLNVNMTDKIKAEFIPNGDDVIAKLKHEGYLTEKGSLTDTFILDGKMSESKFQDKIQGWPEIGSRKAAQKLVKLLTQNLSESRSTIAKMEIIRLVQDFERYNVGNKQFQLKLCSIDHQFSIQVKK